jgi:hypothetical protein
MTKKFAVFIDEDLESLGNAQCNIAGLRHAVSAHGCDVQVVAMRINQWNKRLTLVTRWAAARAQH